MPQAPAFATVGNEAERIDVRLSYRIVRLFSEGLYVSPHKALEELVANSFDAGARRVAVFLSQDLSDQDATIAVLDDGEGMDADGLKQHWMIGKSLKREISTLPLGRQQIGRFGIGKLATYVLANRLTHISKQGSKFYSTSMDYSEVDRRGEDEVEPKTPLRLALRNLTEAQAKSAISRWTGLSSFAKTKVNLFGANAPASWTLAILSNLKPKAMELQPGVLEWVLRTALPLRDDFAIYLNGSKLPPGREGKGFLRKWVLGRDISSLPKPAPSGITSFEDTTAEGSADGRFGLECKGFGRVTGYAEAYRNLLTGKSDRVGRSYGFFVYVRDRLINVEDGHFGISSDELRHGTFGRVRIVVHINSLDEHLQSDRERVREGPILNDVRNTLRAIFNKIRPEVEKAIAGEPPITKLTNKLAGSPASLTRRPIVELARAALEGKAKSRFIALPDKPSPKDRDALLATLESRLETPESFVTGVEFLFEAATDIGIAAYDAQTGTLRINGFHPFVGAFYDQFSSASSGLPLDLIAMAEVLLEAQLFQAGVSESIIDSVMTSRDQYFRDVAQASGRRTALAVSRALQDARNNEDLLETEVVAAFHSLGFQSTLDARKGKTDGIAKANLSADDKGVPRHYSVTLEAKSKQQDGKPVSAAAIDFAAITKHRDDNQSDHAIIVAPKFATTQGDLSQTANHIDRDREQTKKAGAPKTVTLITVDDLARLVRIAPHRGLGLSKLRELFHCRLPEECKRWVDGIEALKTKKQPYKDVIETIYSLQTKYKRAAVAYNGLRVALGTRIPPVEYETDEKLADLCRAMMEMAKGYITATPTTVELDQSPENVLKAIDSATKEDLSERNQDH